MRNLVSSSTYTPNSDRGPLDLADINNLQLSVRRRTSGGYPLRITEIYAEIVYIPGAQLQTFTPPAKTASHQTIYLPIIVKEIGRELKP